MAIRVNTTVSGETTYTAIYRTTDGKQKSAGTFPTRKLAEAAYMAAKAQVLKGVDPSAKAETVYPDQVKGGISVAAYVAQWLPEHELSGHGREVYEWVVKRYIVPALGTEAVAECDARVVAAWLPGGLRLKARSRR